MKIETTIRRTELTVEKTETLTISRTRRLVYEQRNRQEQGSDPGETFDLVFQEVRSKGLLKEPEPN